MLHVGGEKRSIRWGNLREKDILGDQDIGGKTIFK
jgi:hypothetical protein